MNYMSCRFDKDTSMVSRCFHSLTEFPIGGQTDRFTLKCNPTLGSWRRSGYMFFFLQMSFVQSVFSSRLFSTSITATLPAPPRHLLLERFKFPLDELLYDDAFLV